MCIVVNAAKDNDGHNCWTRHCRSGKRGTRIRKETKWRIIQNIIFILKTQVGLQVLILKWGSVACMWTSTKTAAACSSRRKPIGPTNAFQQNLTRWSIHIFWSRVAVMCTRTRNSYIRTRKKHDDVRYSSATWRKRKIVFWLQIMLLNTSLFYERHKT